MVGAQHAQRAHLTFVDMLQQRRRVLVLLMFSLSVADDRFWPANEAALPPAASRKFDPRCCDVVDGLRHECDAIHLLYSAAEKQQIFVWGVSVGKRKLKNEGFES